MELGSPEKIGTERGVEGSRDDCLGLWRAGGDRDGVVWGDRTGLGTRCQTGMAAREESEASGARLLPLGCRELRLEGEGPGVRELEFGRPEAVMTGAGAGSWEASQGLGAESRKPGAVESIQTRDGSESRSWEKAELSEEAADADVDRRLRVGSQGPDYLVRVGGIRLLGAESGVRGRLPGSNTRATKRKGGGGERKGGERGRWA